MPSPRSCGWRAATPPRPALFHRIGATDTRYDIVDSGDALASGDCQPTHARKTNVYVCLYTVGPSDSGAFTVGAGTDSVDRADNALAAVYTHTATLALDTSVAPPPPSAALKLVSNTGQPTGAASITFKWDMAQEFTTGRDPGGYKLTHMDLRIKDGAKTAPSYSVTIRAWDGFYEPGRVLGRLTNPGSLPRGDGQVARFTAPGGGIDLAPRSRYFVVVDVSAPGARRVTVSTAATSEVDRDVVANNCDVINWKIGSQSWIRKAGSTGKWTKQFPRLRLQMAVHGTPKAAPPPVPAMVPAGAVWSASLTVDELWGRWFHNGGYYGCGSWNAEFDKCAVMLSDDDFTHGGVTYAVRDVEWNDRKNELSVTLRGPSDGAARTALDSLTLHVDGRAFALSDAGFYVTDEFLHYHWPFATPWREGQLVTLALSDAATTQAPPAAPALDGARVSATALGLRFDGGLDETSVPAGSAFSVSVAGAARGVSSVAVSADTVTLTLAEAVAPGEAVTVGYAAPADGAQLRGSGGTAVAAFAGQAVTNDTPAPVEALTARVAQAPAEHRGQGKFTVQLAFSAAVTAKAKDAAIEVTGGTLTRAARVDKRQDLWELRLKPSAHQAVTVTLPATADCAAAGAVCTADGRKLESPLSHTVQGPPALRVADARAKEGEAATIDFAVTLSRAAAGAVTVRYATRNGTAKKDKDYVKAKGTLTFAPGETAKTIAVTLLDDAHDEGEETFTLVLKKATGALIADGEAVGTIENDDPLQRAWLARFGRTVGTHVTDAVGERLRGSGAQDSHLTLGGVSRPPGPEEHGCHARWPS